MTSKHMPSVCRGASTANAKISRVLSGGTLVDYHEEVMDHWTWKHLASMLLLMLPPAVTWAFFSCTHLQGKGEQVSTLQTECQW